ncbi:unnamed protein product [Linum tenue]|uniref:Rieske domain-containing protein n=1 Tax=Linum tenue TaxID=586396 RepID=A0AAV0RN51_9ROSI|nr:unnamed protein product [Linum tenue]
MEALTISSSVLSLNFPAASPGDTHISKPKSPNFRCFPEPISSFRGRLTHRSKSKLFPSNAISSPSPPSSVSAEPSPPEIEEEVAVGEEKFDWYAQWYPVMPLCDLDKRVPHAKKVLGIDVVVWWDRNENAWKVFDDMCPHRLAPLSEGRIDQSGRLQCVYHGWCFDGSGNCKLIPQAPLDGPPVKSLALKKLDMDGFYGKLDMGIGQFTAPCIFSLRTNPTPSPSTQRRMALVFICIPVSPGYSRLIWAFPRNFGVWLDKIIPRWMFHVPQNLILDSDLYLLHLEERKIKEFGPTNWQKACFVPTKSDALVVGFRRWFNKYAGGEVDWRGKYSGDLPPTPPREQLLDRSCSKAHKSLNALETILQVVAVGLVCVVAATMQGAMSTAARTGLAILATACFAASRLLAHFVHKNFRYHDYNHAFV